MGRDKQIVVRFSEDELRVLRVRADDEQRPLSQWIRMQLGVGPKPALTVEYDSRRKEKKPDGEPAPLPVIEAPAPQKTEPVRDELACVYGCKAYHVHSWRR